MSARYDVLHSNKLTRETSHNLGDNPVQIRVLWVLQLQLRVADLVQRLILKRQLHCHVRKPRLTSIQQVISEFSTRLLVDKTQLYGSTTVSETFGEGKIEKVASIRSGNSSLILPRRRAPRPEPVPPPRANISWCGVFSLGCNVQWRTWNPWRESAFSAWERSTSKTGSASSAPGYQLPISQTFIGLTLGVVSLRPIVTGSTLSVNESIRSEEVGEGSRTNKVDDSRLEIHLDRTGHVFLVGGFREVDVNWGYQFWP